MNFKPVLFILFIIISLPGCTLSDEEITIKEFFITCSPDDFKKIYTDYKSDTYIPIEITHNGETLPARMRIRGDSSRKYPKKSLKVRFDSKTFSAERDALNFNAEYVDKSYIRQFLTSRFMREAGHTCFYSGHARLYLNGKFLGLYLQIENVDKNFLTSRGLDPNANLYKAKKDGACLSIFDNVEEKWEKKTNTETDWNDLEELINKINSVPDDGFYDFLHEYFDYDMLINIFALNMMLANGSTYYHNYYMYHDINNTGKWYMFPWDMDKSLSYYDWLPYTYHHTSSEWESDNPLIERSLICDDVFDDIKRRIDELYKTLINEDHTWPVIDELEKLLEQSVMEDTTDQIPDVKAWKDQLKSDRRFFKEHYSRLQFQFNNRPTSFQAERTEDICTGKAIIKWHPSVSPPGRKITYNLHYSRHFLLPDSVTTIVKNIDDTTYTIPEKLEQGTWYWKVVATDGEYFTDGFNTKNVLVVREPVKLPNEIIGTHVLDRSGSPYIIEKYMHVPEGASLIIKEGVTILMKENADITVKGNISITGTKEDPVRIYPDQDSDSWGCIYLDGAEGVCRLTNVKLSEGVFNTKFSRVVLDSIHFEVIKRKMEHGEKRDCMIWVHHGEFTLKNSYVEGNGTGEGINVNYADALVENCFFDNIPDAIEYINVNNGVIRNNKIQNSPDDAIDLNACNNIKISGNLIINNYDKAISIGTEQYGPTRNITVEGNIIAGNNTGIAVKDSSDVYINGNTLYGNNVGITCYRKRQDYNIGGKATVENTIISGSKESAIRCDELSEISITYSLCDTEQLTGKGNIHKDPEFVSPEKYDFRLRSSSPCINAGSKNNEGKKNDMGAIEYRK